MPAKLVLPEPLISGWCALAFCIKILHLCGQLQCTCRPLLTVRTAFSVHDTLRKADLISSLEAERSRPRISYRLSAAAVLKLWQLLVAMHAMPMTGLCFTSICSEADPAHSSCLCRFVIPLNVHLLPVQSDWCCGTQSP